ncbi:MAG: lysophospholipid acyltransferase family protein [Patescibacteria group bacterium]
MGTVRSSLWRTVRVIGPGCGTLWWHREGGLSPWDTTTRRQYIWDRAHIDWAKWIFENTDLKLQITGLENFDHNERFIITPNHASWIDIPAMVAAHPSVFCFGAKKELLRWPIVKQVLRYGGQVILDREDRKQAVEALSEGVHPALDTSVLIFPEGTRTKIGELGEFKSGAFYAAKKSGFKILPVIITGSFQAFPSGARLWNVDTSPLIGVHYGYPISPDWKSPQDLREETRIAMRILLEQHS